MIALICSVVAVCAVSPWAPSIPFATTLLTTPTKAGPMMELNLPKISKKPKNSPERSLSGISLPYMERDSA